jgi:hypothetical protein
MKMRFQTVRLGRFAGAIASLVAGAVIVSCAENLPTSTAGSGIGTTLAPQRNLIAVNCTASRASLSVACNNPSSSSSQGISADGRRYDIVFGGNHQYVDITSSNVSYAGTTFSFDVTVKNLIQQTLGTTDGTNPDPAGVRVFFQSGPTVTGGTGTIVVANADGTGTFTGANQAYFQYSASALGADGVLSTNETSSAKTWQLTMPATVTTFAFTIFVSAVVKSPGGYLTLGADTSNVLVGNTRQVRGTVRSALGDSIGVVSSWISRDATVASVNGGTGVVTGVGQGIVTIRGNYHNLVDSTTIFVCNNFSTVGSTFSYTGQNGYSTCFGGGGAGAEYTFMPVNLQSASAQSVTVTGTSIQPVTGPPSPDLRVAHTILSTSGGLTLGSSLDIASDIDIVGRDLGFYNAKLASLREHNNQKFSPSLRTTLLGSPGQLRMTVPAVGDFMDLNTNSACSGSPSVRRGQVKSVSQHLIVVGDTANPAGGFTTAQYDSIALEFDTLVWGTDSANFGAPTDEDNNGRVVAFFTRAVNELSPPASSSVVLGFFASKDVFSNDPISGCSNSNQGEYFYMLVPDPTGAVNSNVRTVSFVRGNTTGTMGHEFQHMINAFRRAYVTGASNFEQGFLNEGLSHVAEELIFYRASVGLAPRGNIVVSQLTTGPNASRRVAAFNTYANQNYGRLRGWLQRPDTAGAFKQNQNSLAVRGVIWAFLRYASDRVNGSDPAFWFSLVNSNLEGTANIQNAIGGANPNDWLRDFTAAMYNDDAGYTVDAKYTQPSWSFRSLYTALNGSYQLAPRALANGTPLTLSPSAGGGTFYGRFSVAAGNYATVTTLNGGPINTPFAIIVTRTK